MELGMRLAGTVEIGGLTAPPDYARARILITQAARMVPGLNSHGAALWMGFRPSFPDSLPVIDRAKGVPNAYLAFGHGHTGISGAPMTGRLIADIISGRPPTIDTSPFRASRFHSHGN
jgi:D-amino-acid dehydrogenase